MATLDAYIQELTTFKDKLPNTTVDIMVRHQFEITDLVKIRLEGKGIDAKGSLIGGGKYADATLFYKQQKGDITDHFTLLDTSSFYDGMVVEKAGDTALIDSKDSKTSLLKTEYGEDILGVNDTETDVIISEMIDPELQKMLDKLPNID